MYANFAIAIFALIWLYLNWLVLLIGSQLAFYHQNPAFLRIGRQEPRLSNAMRERVALNVMMLVGQAFRSGSKTITLREISSALNIPTIALTPIVTAMEENGLLVTTTESENLIPGREMTRISLKEILSVVRIEGETGSYRDPSWDTEINALGIELDKAVLSVVGDKALADLLDQVERSN